ncbi:hypothetical protein QBC38DRAFT_454665 [Podospora fimiseda]|uniref:F-box domain-containing protein n=1 Tax=Podospora fimiseda TaxID=252190 RepID=A0AAN7BRD9_9PEZI|nr:hypothetical protein QBC38DRAFT_454665 [Podospora fimiseda]
MALDKKEQELDPFVAATIHNHKFSAICKLPEEILIMMISQLDLTDPIDLVAIFCLGRVSTAPAPHLRSLQTGPRP